MKRPKKIRFPEICADARELGVHRCHLYQVLAGRRRSLSLMRRYAELQNKKEKNNATA